MGKRIGGASMKVMDVENQVSHIISNPGGFCRGRIAEPTQDTIKTIMRILRTTGKNPNNRFFSDEYEEKLRAALKNVIKSICE